MMLLLFKGKKLPDGTIKTYSGRKYKKINGKWVRYIESSGNKKLDEQPGDISFKAERSGSYIVGYHVKQEGKTKLYIYNSRPGIWNMNEGDSPIKGFLESFPSLKEAKKAAEELLKEENK